MSNNPNADLFVGITSWNSELFLPICLESLREKTKDIEMEICVLDNLSVDRTPEIVARFGAQVISKGCGQGDAMNYLARMSRARFTLLIHSDVVFLNPCWFELVSSAFGSRTALVSPNDIGCGPLTRPFGQGKPESSFLFFETNALHRLRQSFLSWKWRIPLLKRRVNFYGEHITHDLPHVLSSKGFEWEMMDVHVSDCVEEPIYQPGFQPDVWSAELAYLRYGLGNFYSIHGEITHYHNWYDRVPKSVELHSAEGTSKSGGFPLAYVSAYTSAFVRDYRSGKLHIPPAIDEARQPRAL